MKKRIALSKQNFLLKLIEKSLTQKIDSLSPVIGIIHTQEEKKIEKALQKLNEVLQTKNVELEKLLYFLRNPKTFICLQGSILRKDAHDPIPPKDIDLLLLTTNEYLPKPICLKKTLKIEKGEMRLDINIYRHHGYPLSLIGRSLPECIVAELGYQKEKLIFKQYCTYNPKLVAAIMKEKQIQIPALFSEIPYFLNPYHAFFSKRMVYAKLSESIIHKNSNIAGKVIENMLESLAYYKQWILPEDILKIREGIQRIEEKIKTSNNISLLETELSEIVEELRSIKEEEKEALISELKMILKDLKKIRKNIKKICTNIKKNIQKDLDPKELLEIRIPRQEHQLTKQESIRKEKPFDTVETKSFQEVEELKSLEKQIIIERKNKKTESKEEKKLREWEIFKASFSQIEESTLCHFLQQGTKITKDIPGLNSEEITRGLIELLNIIKPLLTEKTIKRFQQHDYKAYQDLLLLIFKKQPETDISAYFIPHTLISLKDSLIGSCAKIGYLTMVLKCLITQKPLGFEEEFIEILDKIISLDIKENSLADKLLDIYFTPSLFDKGQHNLNKKLWDFFLKKIIPYMEKSSSTNHQKILPSIKWGLKNGYNETFSYLIKFQKFIPYESLKPMLENMISITHETEEDVLEKKSETVILLSLYLTSQIAKTAIKQTKPDILFLELIEKTLGYFKEFITRLSVLNISIYSVNPLTLHTVHICNKSGHVSTISAAIFLLKKETKDTSDLTMPENKEGKILNEVIPFLKIYLFNILKSVIVLIVTHLKNASTKELNPDLGKKIPNFLGMIEEFEGMNELAGIDVKDLISTTKSEFITDLTKMVRETEKDIYQSIWFSFIRKIVFKETLLEILLLFEGTNLEEIKKKIHLFFSITLALEQGFSFEKNQKLGLHLRSHILDEIQILFRESFNSEPKIKYKYHLDIFLIFCDELLKILEVTNAQIEKWYDDEKARLTTENQMTQEMIALIKKKELIQINPKIKLSTIEKKKLEKIEVLQQEGQYKIEIEIKANTKQANLLSSLHQEILIILKFLQLLHHLSQILAEERIKEVFKRMAGAFQDYSQKTKNMTYEIPNFDESHKTLYKEIEQSLKRICA